MDTCASDSPSKSKVMILTRQEIAGLLDIKETLEAAERAFKLQAQGKTIMPSKTYLDLPEYKGDFRAMPAYVDQSAGCKWVCAYPNNPAQGLPTVMALIILCDSYTGSPLAIMDGTYITSMRTGAAGGVAVKYLARRDSSSIGLIGAGEQAKTQLLAISKVLPRIEEVKVYDVRKNISLNYARDMEKKLSANIHPVATVEEAADADIVVTTTPSKEPIVKRQHIKPGTHINAIGADAQGKQELDASLLSIAKIVVDDIEQASHSGEINVPLSQGLFKTGQIHGTLGQVIDGKKKGRENEEEITIFDSTGIAVLDIICAKLAYQKACNQKNVTRISLF